ncbi:MAG TPA: non-canonical purine NTP pyrophosphatase [Candidatus Pristimantibacillus sp.]|nr:non-canonical purine NTP pyrophosphatase [Candidatus Pristimantibacillus sp.]
MHRLPVDSSDLVSIGYDPRERVLEIEFKENRIYQYLEVEPDIYERFTRTDSYGEYFYAHINKHYRYRRVNGTSGKAASHTLAFVTGNTHKFHDLQVVLEPFGIEIEQLDLPVDEIQSHDAEKIAIHKAKQAYKLAKRPVVVQDTFWNILALRGFPGAFMRYMVEWLKAEDFLGLMAGKTDRTVVRTHTVVYYDGKHSKVFSKDFMGVIADEARGQGIAIDQIVITAGQTRTNAEIRESDGISSIAPEDSAWAEFAKWYNLQRRLGKV